MNLPQKYRAPALFGVGVLLFIGWALLSFPKADHSQLQKIDRWRKDNVAAYAKFCAEATPPLQVITTGVDGGGIGILSTVSQRKSAEVLKTEIEKLSPPYKVIIVDQAG